MNAFSRPISRYGTCPIPWFATILCLGGIQTRAVDPVAPSIRGHPATQLVWSGGAATLKVVAAGSTPLQYEWFKDGVLLPDRVSQSFVLRGATNANAGDYHAVVRSSLGAVTSKIARVTVLDFPRPTGPHVPELAAFDTNIMRYMVKYGIPGGAVGVVKDGRLVFARGYGFAEYETREPVYPDSMFNLASLSKAVTAAAVMKLVDEGKVSLTNRAFALLNLPPVSYPGATNDPRVAEITVRHLLNHNGGWDRDTARNPLGQIGFNPNSWRRRAAADLGLDHPATSSEYVLWMTGKPLQFRPGSRFAYSNVGYDAAAMLVEKLTGLAYPDWVRRNLFAPLGITLSRIQGYGRHGRHPGEVIYYAPPPSSDPTVFTNPSYPYRNFFEPGVIENLPFVYNNEIPKDSAAGAGGWVSSVIDHLRFISAIDGFASRPDILSSSSISNMTAVAAPGSRDGDYFYGMGWAITPSTNEWYHGGSSDARARVRRRNDGTSYMAVFNMNWDLVDTAGTSGPEMDSALSGAVRAVRSWPSHDLFPSTLSYEAWLAERFSDAEIADGRYTSTTADIDRDGIPNLVEYGTRTDPRIPNPAIRLAPGWIEIEGQRYLTVTFRRLFIYHEVGFVVEGSDDMVRWNPVGLPVGDPLLNDDGTVSVTVRDTVPFGAHPSSRFLRLAMTLRPHWTDSY